MSYSERNKYKLSELVDIIGGGTPKTTIPEYWNGDIPWISVVDFAGDRKYVYETEKHITSLGLENSSTKILQKGFLVISARGTVGEVAVLGRDMAFNQSCYGLCANELTTNNFLYYLLKYKINDLKQNTHGAVFDTITRATFDHIEVDLPSLDIQKEIAVVLSSFDDKIELNRQTNLTLEAIAQAIYKEWFVNFNFPGSTGEMQDSELGAIPKEWRVGLLGESVEFIKGVSYRSAELMPSKYALVTLKSIARGGGFNNDGFKEFDGRYKESQTLVEGDTVIAQTDITQNAEVVGCPAIVENPFNYEKLIASIDIVKCFSKNDDLTAEAIYYFLKDQKFKDYCLSHTNGSTVLHLRSSELPNYKLVIPDKNILKSFCQIVRGINLKMMENNHQARTLVRMRDSLLPRLMNGEIEV